MGLGSEKNGLRVREKGAQGQRKRGSRSERKGLKVRDFILVS
jgi:hypothetical protein